MKLSIATVSISGDLGEKLDAIAAAGFDGVEIFENDLLTYGASPREIGRRTRDLGLEITLFQPFRDFEGLPEPHRSQAFERARRKLDVMGELGAELMLICSSVSPQAMGGIDRAADDLAELGALAADRDLRIGYEALAWGRYVNDHRDAWEIVRRAGHSHVGLILDSFHSLARGIDSASIRAVPGDRIFLVQVADAPRLDMDLLPWSRHFRNMPGEGDLPVTDFVAAVAATGYGGPLSLEIFNDQFRGGSPRAIATDGHRSLTYLLDQVAAREPGLGLGVRTLPPRIEVKGVEFVEFAADEAGAGSLTALIGTMGFTLAARHRSKDVRLFRQGGINLAVNTEREGLAHSTYVTHGTSAYAIGLRVDNAAATVERAQAMGAQVFEQPVAEGELRIPAIRGVGGGVIYFVDDTSELSQMWEREFVQEPSAAGAAAAGLTRIDHVAQTMNYDEMLTWVLFYVSIFATAKSPIVDVLDPGGLVRSQVIETASGSLRLTLNGADSNRTIAGRFLKASFGSSVQHLAFASNDIFATADAMRGMGFEPLGIQPNYYDDLAARFGLDETLASRLQSANVLYDRDASGEFFQFYSQTFGEGFFFEIVERLGDYRGYGAPNAPFRIAAQRRSKPQSIPIR